ncbi:MAG: 3-phosphoshikimate 1-carboxyvinyltransferase [Planctomycetaceae bacterium]
MVDSLLIAPSGPVHGTIRPPGSKSLTNRAFIVAALADGTSTLRGVLDSQDTRVMVQSLNQLGIAVTQDLSICTATVAGCAGRPSARNAELWLENSGTSIRFLTALATLCDGSIKLDGNARMRQRPIGDLVDALNSLGANVSCVEQAGFPPVAVHGCPLSGGTAKIAANLSSQFLSALLMAAPCARNAVELSCTGTLVSEPYVEMTIGVMRAFGATVAGNPSGSYRIEPQTYHARDYDIEPDASAASYFFAAAAITGGEVTVTGLSKQALQGDVEFVSVLEKMGCRVSWKSDSITLSARNAPLRGVDVDMNAISDTAQTLAAVAVFAEGPTTIRNVAHIRHKETDRIHAVATELRRLGISVDERDDGLTIHPGPLRPATIQTYDDHRMAMSFALVGLKSPGIQIADPGCTVKTYPNYFEDLRTICTAND